MRIDDMRAWQRLGRAVAKRRAELRLNQGDLHGRGGPSLATVQSIEGARADTYRDRTLADLERALGWARGSVEAVLFSGNEPTVIVAPPSAGTSDVVSAILNDPGLLPEAKQHLVSQYGLLLRIQAAGTPVPAAAPSQVDPMTPEEEEFVARGQSDLDATEALRLVEDDQNRR